MKTLVTGAAGFIGSHLVDGLLDKGYDVRVLDNLYSGDMDNLSQHENNSSFEFIKGDIREIETVIDAIEDVDTIFHEAAITSVPASIKNPKLTNQVNVDGTKNLLETARDKEVENFIFASSCAVYGDPETIPLTEESRIDPNSPYAESKLLAEKECKKYSKKGLETVIFRYFNVYGPRQGGGKYSGVISKFLKRIENDEPPIIFGDGEQTRDFVHVKDVVKANILALEAENISGEVFNIGTGNAVSVNELCRTIMDMAGEKSEEPVYEEARDGDIRHSRADIGKAIEKIGYSPEITLKEGLKTIIE